MSELSLTSQRTEPASIGNRIKSLRMLTGCSRKIFSLKTQISENTLKIWEDPQKRKGLSKKGAIKLIEAVKNLGIECSLEWLLEGVGHGPSIINNQFLPETGEVSWGEEEAIFKDIEAFKKNNPNPIVVMITDGSLLPYYSYEDYVGGSKRTGKDIDLLIGSICIIELDTGVLIRKILKKDANGYTICVLNKNESVEETKNNVEIISAAKVVFCRRREFPKSVII